MLLGNHELALKHTHTDKWVRTSQMYDDAFVMTQRLEQKVLSWRIQ